MGAKEKIVWNWINGKITSLSELEARAWRIPGVIFQILENLVSLGFAVRVEGYAYRGIVPGESKKYN